MQISKIIGILYIRTRLIIRKFIFLLFSEKSKIINLFVKIDLLLRKVGVLRYYLNGKFKYEENIFHYDPKNKSVASSILTNGTYEHGILAEMKSTLKQGSIFIDGGANIGFFSILGSKLVGPNGKVIAFEPAPSTLKYLNQNIKINKISNIIVSDKGLSSIEKRLSFLIKNNSEENSILKNEGKKLQFGEKIINIDATTIDKFCKKKNLEQIDLIKLDIEGQELEAIKGSREVLLNNKNIKIIFELNIVHNSEGIQFALKIFDELKKFNFSNFEALLEPKITIKDLNNPDNLKMLKKITDRYAVNVLASR